MSLLQHFIFQIIKAYNSGLIDSIHTNIASKNNVNESRYVFLFFDGKIQHSTRLKLADHIRDYYKLSCTMSSNRDLYIAVAIPLTEISKEDFQFIEDNLRFVQFPSRRLGEVASI